MTSEELKAYYSMRDIVERYGISINRQGFCRCPFHTGDNTPSLKVYKDNFHCHACGADGDIFTFVMGMDGISFKDAYKLLGGEYKPSYSARRKIAKAMEKRRIEQERQRKAKEELQRICFMITAYRNALKDYDPLSEEYAYIYNKLQYQEYLLEQWGDEHEAN